MLFITSWFDLWLEHLAPETGHRKVEGAWSDATSIRRSNVVSAIRVAFLSLFIHLKSLDGRDWRFLNHIHTISTTFSLFQSLSMHFIIAFMSITSRIWACVAICARTVAIWQETVATFTLTVDILRGCSITSLFDLWLEHLAPETGPQESMLTYRRKTSRMAD